MAKDSSERHIDLSAAEIAALSSALGVDLATTTLTSSSNADDLVVGRKSLIRRKLATDDSKGMSMADPVRAIVDVLVSPALIGRIERSTVAAAETAVRSYFAVPELTIEVQPIAAGLHRFTPIETQNLLLRILDFASLFDWAPRSTEPFEVSERLIELLRKAEQDDPAVATMMAGSSAPRASLDQLSRASAGGVTVSAALLHRPEETLFEGGELTWLDGGEAGLWTLEPIETPSADPLIRVSPTTALKIAKELFSYLPGSDG